ncbi:MAG: 50S ribosomal protein L11 methyltransferase [Rhizomicrobium sp.]
MIDATAFIGAHTRLGTAPLVPEIRLHLAGAMAPLIAALGERHTLRPYWAFAWSGGQGLARYTLDHPDCVRGKTVLDFGAGSGLNAIAAMKAGAKSVLAADIDPLAAAAIALNAAANGVAVDMCCEDVLTGDGRWDVILCGDVCYEGAMMGRVLPWLEAQGRAGATILLGDPGRGYTPKSGFERIACYDGHTVHVEEDFPFRETHVYRFTRAV